MRTYAVILLALLILIFAIPAHGQDLSPRAQRQLRSLLDEKEAHPYTAKNKLSNPVSLQDARWQETHI